MDYIEFYNKYRDKIFSYFYYNLRNDRELAEDLTSETFLKWFYWTEKCGRKTVSLGKQYDCIIKEFSHCSRIESLF